MIIVPTDTPGFSSCRSRTSATSTPTPPTTTTCGCPYDNLVGDENKGWKLITKQLNHERVTLCSSGIMERGARRRRAGCAQETTLADGERLIDQPWVQHNLAWVHARLEVLRLLNWQVAWHAENGDNLDPAAASAVKVFGTRRGAHRRAARARSDGNGGRAMSIRISIGRQAGARGMVAALADLVALMKLRVVSLLVVTGVCGYLAGAAGKVQLSVLLAVAGGGALAAGGANALNCALDRDLDAVMTRTRSRPIPDGRVLVWQAVALGIAMNVAAAAWLIASANVLAAALALAGTVWYLVIYTMWLKRRSTQNIVIGGAAGCFPPLVGWAAATGSLDATALTLAAVIFLWTPPHFWALATLLRKDYRRAGVPMLPAVVSIQRTANQAFVYAVATVLVSLGPVLWDGADAVYAVSAAGLGAVFLLRADAFRREADTPAARRLFRYSLIYLAALFAALVVDRMLSR